MAAINGKGTDTMTSVQFYKQRQPTGDDDGSYMAPGWYFVRQRPSYVAEREPIPYGLSTGPFSTKLEAQRYFRRLCPELKDAGP